jgi:hypothetical protein
VEIEGAHNWSYWHAHVSSGLLFFEEILRDALKPALAPV